MGGLSSTGTVKRSLPEISWYSEPSQGSNISHLFPAPPTGLSRATSSHLVPLPLTVFGEVHTAVLITYILLVYTPFFFGREKNPSPVFHFLLQNQIRTQVPLFLVSDR